MWEVREEDRFESHVPELRRKCNSKLEGDSLT